MPHSDTRVYVHFVWGTKGRQPWLDGELEPAVHACVAAECRRLGAQVLAVNGVADHVHLLVRLPPAVSVAALAKQVKGSSSHLVNHRLPCAEPFAWQRGYGAYSVGEAGIAAVRSYIEQQKERHAEGRIVPEMEPAPD